MITGGTVEFLKRNPEKRIDKKITGVWQKINVTIINAIIYA
jgi:hypothetical protein